MLHAGGDGRNNGLGIIVNVYTYQQGTEREERLEETREEHCSMDDDPPTDDLCQLRLPQTDRTEAQKEAFSEEVERLAGLSDSHTMLSFVGDFNVHIGC